MDKFSAVIIGLLLLGLIFVRLDSAASINAQRDASIKGCVAASARSTFDSNLGYQLQERVGNRGAKGDADSAARYGGASDAIVRDIVGEGPNKATVTATKQADGTYLFELTPEAAKAQRAGCEARYER